MAGRPGEEERRRGEEDTTPPHGGPPNRVWARRSSKPASSHAHTHGQELKRGIAELKLNHTLIRVGKRKRGIPFRVTVAG